MASTGSAVLPDLSYGGSNDGIARADFIGRADNGLAGVALTGDRLLVAGVIDYEPHESGGDVGFAQFNSGGRLDPGFGAANDGRARLGLSGAQMVHRIAHADGGGTLLVGGMHDFSAMTIGRLDRTGAIDASFNGIGFRNLGGGFFLNGGSAAMATDLSRLSDGKILVSGAAGSTAMACFALARLNADGSTDTSFGGGHGGACAAPPLPGGRPFAYSSAHTIAADGRILLAGWAMRPGGSGYDMAVARFTAAGVLDTSFGPAGDGWTFAAFEHGGINDYARAIAVDGAGRIVVAGDFAGTNSIDLAVVRWLPDGRPDAGFGEDGKVWFDLDWGDGMGTSHEDAHSVFALPDQRILVGARSSNIGTTWMLKSNGDLDRAFADDGVLKQAHRNAPITSKLASEHVVFGGDYLYMIGTIRSPRPNGGNDEDFGAVRYVMPLFRDGFESAD